MRPNLQNALLAAALAVAPCVAAQTIPSGTWTGTVAPPDAGALEVTFAVQTHGDSVSIMLHSGDHGTFLLQDVSVEPGVIRFVFVPGIAVNCTLSRQDDGSYRGDCIADDGSAGQMVMIPPADG